MSSRDRPRPGDAASRKESRKDFPQTIICKKCGRPLPTPTSPHDCNDGSSKKAMLNAFFSRSCYQTKYLRTKFSEVSRVYFPNPIWVFSIGTFIILEPHEPFVI